MSANADNSAIDLHQSLTLGILYKEIALELTSATKGSPMTRRFIVASMCSALSLIGATGFAYSDTIGRYECSFFGTVNSEPIGDRSGHNLVSYQFSCFGVDGLLKGAVYSGISISEWEGPKGTFLLGGGIHRSVGGFAVTQLSEVTSSVIMKDGKPAGTTGSGTVVFKFASGTLAAISGKTVKLASKTIGLNRFELEFSEP